MLAIGPTTAVSHGHCYHESQETVQVKRALMNAASRRILILDYTKFSRQGLYALAPLTDFDLVLTDDRMPPAGLYRRRSGDFRAPRRSAAAAVASMSDSAISGNRSVMRVVGPATAMTP